MQQTQTSEAEKKQLGRQLEGIKESLVRASRRRDEEFGIPTPMVGGGGQMASLRGGGDEGKGVGLPHSTRCGGDEGKTDPSHTPRLEQWENAEVVRQERRHFEQLVAAQKLHDAEREKTIKFLLARSNLAKLNEMKEAKRQHLEAKEEAVSKEDRVALREKEVEEFEDMMIKDEEDMEQEDYEERLRRWEEGRRNKLRTRAKAWARRARTDFLHQTNYGAQYQNPDREKAELLRLEDHLFERLVAEMEAQDAQDLDKERKRLRSEDAGESANKRVHPIASRGDSAMVLSSDEQENEHPVPSAAHLRGGAEGDGMLFERRRQENKAEREAQERLEHISKHRKGFQASAGHARKDANPDSSTAAVKTAATPQENEAEEKRKADAERWRKIDRDFQNMLEKNMLGTTRGMGKEHAAARDVSAEGEPRRRTESVHPEAERSYMLPPDSPADRPPSSDKVSEFEARSGNASQFNAVMRGGHATPLDDDPRALLAELSSFRDAPGLLEAGDHDAAHGSDSLTQILAESESSYRFTHATAATFDDSRGTLEGFLPRSAPGLQELRSPTSREREAPEAEEDDDLSMLRARLEELWSSIERSPSLAPATVVPDEDAIETTTTARLDPAIIPYVIALELEHSECEWEIAQAWTRRLFSSSLDSQEVQKDKDAAVAHAEEALRKTIASVMEAETQSRREAEETQMQRCLIVSNLAAGADAEDVERPFWSYRYDITNITLLQDRDPLKRTQTAHVNFASRETAIRASYTSGQVYGLIFDVKLAVPVQHAFE